jgi:hypothetical protein
VQCRGGDGGGSGGGSYGPSKKGSEEVWIGRFRTGSG